MATGAMSRTARPQSMLVLKAAINTPMPPIINTPSPIYRIISFKLYSFVHSNADVQRPV